jgi:hypothetical protein
MENKGCEKSKLVWKVKYPGGMETNFENM